MLNKLKKMWIPIVVFMISLICSLFVVVRIVKNATNNKINTAKQTSQIYVKTMSVTLQTIKSWGEMDVAYFRYSDNLESAFDLCSNSLLNGVSFVKYVALYNKDHEQIRVNNDHNISCDSSIMTPKYFDKELEFLNNHPEIVSNKTRIIYSNIYEHTGYKFFYILYEFDLSGENAYYVVEIRLQDFLNYVQIKTLTSIYGYEYELSAISDNVTTKVESNVSNYKNRSVEEKAMYKGIQGVSLRLYSKNNFVDFDVSMSAITLSVLVIGSLTAFGFYISYLIHKNYNYQKESRMDLLTHIPNEKAELSRLIEYEKAGKPYAIFYLDIDDFKSINDQYGHDIGDEVLQKVAKILTLSVDVKDLASRIHGDEFSVIEEGLFTEEEAELEARRIESSLDTTLYIQGYHIDIQVSCGYAIVPLHTNKYDVAIRLSDNKMYEVKRKHKENKRDD